MTSKRLKGIVFALVLVHGALMMSTAFAQVTVTIGNWWGDSPGTHGQAFKYLTEQFMASHPNIVIEGHRGDGMTSETLLVAIAAGNPPDIYFENRFALREMAAAGAYQPITRWAEAAGLSGDMFLERPWVENLWEGELYAIPHHTDARGLFWNTDLFLAAGFAVDRPPATWEELHDYTIKLTRIESDGSIAQLGFDPWFMSDAIYLFGFGNGATFMDEDGREAYLTDPALVETLEFMLSLQQAVGSRQVINEFYAKYANVRGGAFVAGAQAMQGGGSWQVADYVQIAPDLNFDVAPMPVPAGKPFVTWGEGFAFAIPRGARNVDAAFQYIEYMMSHDAQVYYGVNTTQIPVLRSALAQLPHENLDPRQVKFYAMTENMRYLPGGPLSRKLWNVVVKATDEVLNERVPPLSALIQAQEEITDEIRSFFENL